MDYVSSIWDMTSNVSYLNEKASGSRNTQSPDLYRLPPFEHDLEEKRYWQLKKENWTNLDLCWIFQQ